MSKNKIDNIKNWYDTTKKYLGKGIKNDKHYNKHLVKPCKMISIIGPTGSGKTNILLEFLERKNNSFYEVIIFTGSTADEPLYNLLREKLEGVVLIDNVDELPELTKYNEEDKTIEKLIIFDDIINLNKKQLQTVQKWFNSARKYGFTCIAMCQRWTDEPIQMRNNNNMIWIFKLNDINSINQILKTSNNENLPIQLLKDKYFEAVKTKGDFFNIDLTESGPLRFRKNFIGSTI